MSITPGEPEPRGGFERPANPMPHVIHIVALENNLTDEVTENGLSETVVAEVSSVRRGTYSPIFLCP